MRRLSMISLASLALVASLLVPGASQARDAHPLIRRAIAALQAARSDLQNAARDYCGHRVEALEATNAALKQLQEALACAQRKEDSASAEVRPSLVGPSAAKQHPNIYRAVDALGAAEGELQNASHDFCGHRVEALDATRTALNQLKRAIQCAEK